MAITFNSVITPRPLRFQANTAIIDTQWGDGGKGKIVDLLAADADIVGRATGGPNAGHTIKLDATTEFKFHMMPSGILRRNVVNIIGNGTVLDPDKLLAEIQDVKLKGISTDNLHVSDRAQVILPLHVELDQKGEAALGKEKIGTTGKGIGPTYQDKASRLGIRMGDLVGDPEVLGTKLQRLYQKHKPTAQAAERTDTLRRLMDWGDQLKPYITDTTQVMHDALAKGKTLLIEGAQGTMLDVDHGSYPFVTASNPVASGTATGLGIGPNVIDRIVGVTKAYTTRVGGGDFLTELDIETDAIGKHLSTVGREVGTTTGRKRRCGWFDAVVTRYANQVNGLTEMAITKLDVLDGLPNLQICKAYRDPATGREITAFPANADYLRKLVPVYEQMPGWQGSVKNARKVEDLPKEARAYLQRIAQLTGAPITIVSVGPERDQTIVIDNPVKAPPRPKVVLGDHISHSLVS